MKVLTLSLAFALLAPSVQALILHAPEEGQDAAGEAPVENVESSKAPTPVPDPAGELRSKASADLGRHLGKVGMGTGIYLGDGFVMTSAHVGCYPFQLADGSFYRPDYQSWRVIPHEDGSPSDVAIFRIGIPHGDEALGKLPPLPIAKESPSPGSSIMLFGSGLSQDPEPAVMKSNEKVVAVLGYRVGRQRDLLSGSSVVDEIHEAPIASGKGETHCFSTRFGRDGHHAQASDGDSGGASFVFNEGLGRWELAGCIIAVSQKAGFVPFGSRTFMADLSRYRSLIPTGDEDSDGGPEETFLVSSEETLEPPLSSAVPPETEESREVESDSVPM